MKDKISRFAGESVGRETVSASRRHGQFSVERLDQSNERLGRVDRGLNDLGMFMRQIAVDQAKRERFHSHHVERMEDDVANLKDRVRRLEERAGTGS